MYFGRFSSYPGELVCIFIYKHRFNINNKARYIKAHKAHGWTAQVLVGPTEKCKIPDQYKMGAL